MAILPFLYLWKGRIKGRSKKSVQCSKESFSWSTSQGMFIKNFYCFLPLLTFGCLTKSTNEWVQNTPQLESHTCVQFGVHTHTYSIVPWGINVKHNSLWAETEAGKTEVLLRPYYPVNTLDVIEPDLAQTEGVPGERFHPWGSPNLKSKVHLFNCNNRNSL